MKSKEQCCKMLAEFVVNLSVKSVKKTVGKSCPIFVHEVKIPEEVKNLYLKN